MEKGNLDVEWVKLIIKAKELGLSQTEVRIFFANYKNWNFIQNND